METLGFRASVPASTVEVASSFRTQLQESYRTTSEAFFWLQARQKLAWMGRNQASRLNVDIVRFQKHVWNKSYYCSHLWGKKYLSQMFSKMLHHYLALKCSYFKSRKVLQDKNKSISLSVEQSSFNRCKIKILSDKKAVPHSLITRIYSCLVAVPEISFISPCRSTPHTSPCEVDGQTMWTCSCALWLHVGLDQRGALAGDGRERESKGRALAAPLLPPGSLPDPLNLLDKALPFQMSVTSSSHSFVVRQ